MKKIVVILTVLLVVGFFLYIYFEQKTTISQTLSQRSKEHISERIKANEKHWRDISLQEKVQNEQKNSEVLSATNEVGECFTFSIHLGISSKRKLGDCNIRITTKSPKAHVTISATEVQTAHIDSISALQMRRNDPKLYIEEHKTVKGHTYTIFEKESWEYEKTAFSLRGNTLISMTLSAPSNRDLDSDFDKILSSLEYLL